MKPVTRVDVPPVRRVQAWFRRAFGGCTWQGIGLIATLCVLNALRKMGFELDRSLHGWKPFLGWVRMTAFEATLGCVVAVPVALAVVAVSNLGPREPRRRLAAYVIAILLSCMVGVKLMLLLQLGVPEHQSRLDPYFVALVRYALFSALVAAIFVYLRAAEQSTMRMNDAHGARARFTQQMEAARLRMLQAQVEPHFLFNALANMRGLYASDPRSAEQMLDNLAQYFAAALPQLRSGNSNLGQEADLTRAYLEIQAIRMGKRLAFEVDVPPELRAVPLPPLMLLTLVENAIKHGLAPSREGGTVRITAQRVEEDLVLRVADSGGGFTRTSGKGTGLANVRARLTLMYGPRGRLALGRNVPQGVVATIAIPLVAERVESVAA